MLITLYKIGELHFRLLGTNGFHVKAKSERFTAACLGCCHNLKINMKISRRRLADYVKTLHQKVCHTWSTIIFLHPTNEIIDLWHCRWRCPCQIINSLLWPTGFGSTPPLTRNLEIKRSTVLSQTLKKNEASATEFWRIGTNHMTRHRRSAICGAGIMEDYFLLIYNTHVSFQSCSRRSTIDIRRSPWQ